MALDLKFIGSHASIEHLNLRKQGNDEARVLAIDIKVKGEVHAAILKDLLGSDEDVSGLFWSATLGKDPNALKSYAFKDIAISSEWCNCDVRIGNHTAKGDFRKISFAPAPGRRLDIEGSISIENPGELLLDYLVSKIKENILLRIESQPELLAGAGRVS